MNSEAFSLPSSSSFDAAQFSGGTEAANDGENSPSNAIICRDGIIPKKNKARVKFIQSRDWKDFDKWDEMLEQSDSIRSVSIKLPELGFN